jgi:hypothetical protein
MASKTTKTLSVRVPLEYYFDVIKKTSNQGVNINDYILMLIHNNINSDNIFNDIDNYTLKKYNQELLSVVNNLSKIISLPEIKKVIKNIPEEELGVSNMSEGLFKILMKHSYDNK